MARNISQEFRRGRIAIWMLGLLGGLILAGSMMWLRGERHASQAAPLGKSSHEIIPGVFMIGDLGPSAAYAVETSDGLVLIDSGLEPDAAPLKRELSRLGLDWHRIKAILVTHGHGDHVGGIPEFRAATGATVYAGAGDVETLKQGGPREAFFSTFNMAGYVSVPTPVDVAIQTDQTITVGDRSFEAISLPGHTPGSVAYLLDCDGQRVLFAGDVVTMLRGEDDPHPMGLRPLGTYSAYLPPVYRGDVQTFIASLKGLRDMPAPDLVLPGHPASDPLPESPALSRERWTQILDAGIAELEQLKARYDRDGADFLDGRPRKLLPGLDYLGDHQSYAVYTLSVGDRLILINAPGGPGVASFVDRQRTALGQPSGKITDVLLTSCGNQATAGLVELVAGGDITIYAPQDGVETIKKLCPPKTRVVSAAAFPQAMSLTMETIPLQSRGVSPQAYLLNWDSKRVLISGRIPILFDARSTSTLIGELGTSRVKAMEYLLSIRELSKLKPELWLPAMASHGQNANIYDGEWDHVIANNYRIGRSVLDRSQ